MIASGKTLSMTGAYLVRLAKQAAGQLLKSGRRSSVRSVDGYLVKASRTGQIATGYVIDPPGMLALLNDSSMPGKGLLTLHPRDFYATFTKMPHVTTAANTAARAALQTRYTPLGFDPGDGPDENPFTQSAKIGREVVHTADQYLLCSLSVRTMPDAGAPNFDLLIAPGPGEVKLVQTFAALTALNAQTASGGGSGPATGFVLSGSQIDQLAPGYVLIRQADHGYTGWEYGACAPAGVLVGSMLIAAIPVTKQGGTGVTDWGEAAMLLVGLSRVNSAGVEDGQVIRWHHLWTPAEHPQEAMRPGPWVHQPSYRPPFNADKWDEAWMPYNGSLTPANLGSRPSWIDSLSCQLDGQRALFRFKYVGLAASPFIHGGGVPSADLATAEAEAVIEISAGKDGEVSAAYPAHEVFTSSTNPDAGQSHSPYQRFVVGKLPLDKVKVTVPVATLLQGEQIVRLDAEYAASRVTGFSSDLHEWSGRMLDPRTSEFGFRVSRGADNFFLTYSAIGAGLLAPVRKIGIGVDAPLGLFGSMVSYKTWNTSALASTVSDSEIAVIVFEDWQSAGDLGAGTHARVVFINTQDGTHRLTGRIGYFHTKTLEYRRSPVLCVIQREIRNQQDEVTQKAVLLVSGPGQSQLRISRDSGETWQTLVSGATPDGGSFYLGNLITVNVTPGDARIAR